LARSTIKKQAPKIKQTSAAPAAVKRSWVQLLPIGAALIIVLLVLLTSGVLGGKAALLSEPGQTHIHTTLLYPDGKQDRILVGAHDGLYERSADLKLPGWWVNNGVGKTDTMGLGYSPARPSHLYVVGHSIGVAESSDSGANWQNLLPGAGASYNPNDVHALAVDPVDGSLYIWIQSRGLWRSTDSGANWQHLKANAGGQVVCLVVARTASGKPVVYEGTTGGLLRSIDQGANWLPASGAWQRDGVYSLANSGSLLYAGTPDGLYQSHDQGSSWQSVPGVPVQPVAGVSIDLVNPMRQMVMFNDTTIYESSDGGASWQAAAMSSTP
jgi:photosystem II stability/assembly factor-like uncharacterized protein